MSLYAVALRVPHPAILSYDFVKGVWFGVCVGIEIVGLNLLRKSPPANSA